ncbi:MAG: radical SAM protein [Planctomycetes bacterium]|nr:radical SAM protein [Planctomycetota bacterium]
MSVMPQQHLAPVTAAGLLATDWCPAQCRHCYESAGPGGTRWMTVDAAAGHLAALARLGAAAEGIHIGGGEPFGDFDRLLAIVRAARQAGLAGIGYVETNAFWATDADDVRRRLAALAQAGMMQISISADPYHQEFVPPERVRLLYEAARDVLGPAGVRARRWKWLHAPRDVAAMPEHGRMELFREFLARYPERMTSRCAERLSALAERVPADALPADGCRAALLEAGHVHIDPDGWVYPGTCAGIVLGRAAPEQPLDRLLAAWHPADSPLVAALAEGGPRRLAQAAAGHGFAPDAAGYAGKCHLCWRVRRHLVRAGAGGPALQPPQLYLTF